ncbi:hypothetical protein FCV25MIE_33574, partial [Fagus crenata]
MFAVRWSQGLQARVSKSHRNIAIAIPLAIPIPARGKVAIEKPHSFLSNPFVMADGKRLKSISALDLRFVQSL